MRVLPASGKAVLAWFRATPAAQRARRWATDLLVILAIITVVGAWQTRHHPRGPAPVLDAPMLDRSAAPALQPGRPSVVAFWAPWCVVCKQESANLDRLRAWVGDRVNVVTVAAGYRDVAEVQAFVTERGASYPVVLGGDAAAAQWRVAVYPTVYFLNDDGQITNSVVGYTSTLGLWWRTVW